MSLFRTYFGKEASDRNSFRLCDFYESFVCLHKMLLSLSLKKTMNLPLADIYGAITLPNTEVYVNLSAHMSVSVSVSVSVSGSVNAP